MFPTIEEVVEIIKSNFVKILNSSGSSRRDERHLGKNFYALSMQYQDAFEL